MNGLLYYFITDGDGDTFAKIGNAREFQKDTWSPFYFPNVVFSLDRIHGKTHAEKKAFLEDLAINYSNHEPCKGLSLGEVLLVNNFFEKYGKRYGLLKEFRENGII